MRGLIALLLAAATLAGCAPAQPQGPAQPALWKLSDADTTIYLFGTIHILPKGLAWQSPKIAEAMRRSDGLVLETVLNDDRSNATDAMQMLALSPGLPPLSERVPPEKRAALDAAIRKAGVLRLHLDALETWAAALTLSSASLGELGASPDYGAEPVLLQQFRAAGKPVQGLETPLEQLSYFDTLPEAAQRQFLIAVIDDKEDPRAEFAAMVAAWGAGDQARIALTFDDAKELSPELTDALLVRRNRHWADWIAARMAQPGTLFVAVGAGHLAGPQSLEAILAARGMKAVRLQ